MNLIAQIREDIAQITNNADEFAVPIVFSTPTGFTPAKSVTCNGIAVKHHTTVDKYGLQIQGKTARVTINEAALVALAYPVRNADHKVAIKDHNVSFTDSAGLTYNAVITATMPDETTGMIVCMLGDKV